MVFLQMKKRYAEQSKIYSIGIAITVTEPRVGIFVFGLQNFKNISNAQIASIPDRARVSGRLKIGLHKIATNDSFDFLSHI